MLLPNQIKGRVMQFDKDYPNLEIIFYKLAIIVSSRSIFTVMQLEIIRSCRLSFDRHFVAGDQQL